MDLQLAGKLALVSGSTAGIGLAIAGGLAREGARVIVNGRTEARVESAKREILTANPAAAVESFAGDLSRADTAAELVKRFAAVDILINNLGTYGVKAFEELSDDDWRELIETNFMSGLRLSRHYLPRMKQAGWGRIIFISSESAANIPTEMIHYGVTKTMQVALSRGLAETTSGTGVTVNSVLAGPTRSEGVGRFLEEVAKAQGTTLEAVEENFFQTARPSSILQRFATTEEIAALTVFLASPLSAATNGAAMRAEGGLLRSIL